MESFPALGLGPLPGVDELAALQRRGVRHLVNVSGRPADALHDARRLDPFSVHDFLFPDAFAAGSTLAWPDFLRDWGRPVRDSVDTLAALLHTGQRVHCFCHQGRSRSAVVAVAALMRAWELDVVESLGLVRAKNPRARFTPRARACLDWLQQEDPSDEPLLERT
jgi:hypothetical protein